MTDAELLKGLALELDAEHWKHYLASRSTQDAVRPVPAKNQFRSHALSRI